jgi:putative membrane protein
VGGLVSGIEVRTGRAALLGAIGLGIANAVLRPLLLVLAFPITLLTLGLFAWVVNALVLMLVAAFVDDFEVDGFWPALWGSVLLAALNFGVGLLFGV